MGYSLGGCKAKSSCRIVEGGGSVWGIEDTLA